MIKKESTISYLKEYMESEAYIQKILEENMILRRMNHKLEIDLTLENKKCLILYRDLTIEKQRKLHQPL